ACRVRCIRSVGWATIWVWATTRPSRPCVSFAIRRVLPEVSASGDDGCGGGRDRRRASSASVVVAADTSPPRHQQASALSEPLQLGPRAVDRREVFREVPDDPFEALAGAPGAAATQVADADVPVRGRGPLAGTVAAEEVLEL